MRSLQSYADTVSPRKRPRNSCSNCVFLAPQTSPESRIVWSLTVHRRRAPNSRPRADRENRAFEQRSPVTRVCSLNSIYESANCFELHRTTKNGLNLRLVLDSRFGQRKDREQREDNGIPPEDRVLFLEIYVPDASEFSAELHVRGVEVGSHQVLRAESAAVANGIAALLLYLRDQTGQVPHAYYNWTEGNPVLYMIRYVLSGYGEVAPITREVLRQAEHNPARRAADPCLMR